MKKIIYLITIALLCSSCVSRLRVDVNVADRDKILIVSKKYLKEINYNPAPKIVALENFNTVVKKNKTVLLDEILNSISAKMNSSIKEEDRVLYNKKLTERIDSIKIFTDEARISYENNNIDRSFKSINKANIKISELNDTLKYCKINKNAFGINVFDSYQPSIQKLKENINTTITIIETEQNLRTHFPILGDELASFISKKENKKIWRSVFNKTYAFSLFGNTDIAMILRSNPPEKELRSGDYNNNFTIKGVKLDASDVTNAIFNGLTQTINFIANTQGLPSNIGNTPVSTDNPLPNQSPVMLTIQTDIDKLAIKKKKLVSYKQLLLTKIELENIKNTDTLTDAKEKAKRIKEYWEGLKIELIKP